MYHETPHLHPHPIQCTLVEGYMVCQHIGVADSDTITNCCFWHLQNNKLFDMKVGSLVELVDDNWSTGSNSARLKPVKNKIYTVRSIFQDCIRLEEIINEGGSFEDVFYTRRFRERLPPLSITIEQFDYEKA